jgi:mannose-1-phosphate guanylyltransferase
MRVASENGRLWTVILAGGEGRRMRPLIKRWLGGHRPKQYCTFVGTRSMFQHTVDRADMLAAPERRITVVDRSHRLEVSGQVGRRYPGEILLQPANRDTAAGIFLPLTYVRARDPLATVAVFPSDHFIFPGSNFLDTVRCAVKALESGWERIILLGATPDRPESDYGWIQPGSEIGCSSGRVLRQVSSFVEKPAMKKGALWNTLVFVARVETLWNMGRRAFPRLIDLFEWLEVAIDTRREDSVFRQIYDQMPAHNFSSDLLARVTDNVGVIELQDVLWSDWGRPQRIAETLDLLGKQPAFPRECLMAS